MNRLLVVAVVAACGGAPQATPRPAVHRIPVSVTVPVVHPLMQARRFLTAGKHWKAAETLTQLCSDEPWRCLSLTHEYLAAAPQYPSGAVSILAAHCDGLGWRQCRKLAVTLSKDPRIPAAATRVMLEKTCAHTKAGCTADDELTRYKTACAGGDGFACVRAARIFKHGVHAQRSLSRATQYFSAACKLDNGTGCFELGWIEAHARGDEKTVTRRVDELFRRGCDLGSQAACDQL